MRCHSRTWLLLHPFNKAWRAWGLLACLSGAVMGAAWAGPGPNDTGQTLCLDFTLATVACAGTGQDGEFGRDASHPKPRDGAAGFRFVKIGADGTPLVHQASEWACVLDRITQRWWEAKTDDGSPHDQDRTFTRYGDGRPGDASELVQAANAQALCGHSDWRLPDSRELQGLVHYGLPGTGPVIDTRWFRHTRAAYFWTASASGAEEALLLDMVHGIVSAYPRRESQHVRLVRDAPVADVTRQRFVLQGDEALDRSTGLVWQRCALGQRWRADRCAGQFESMGWHTALGRAQAFAAEGWRLPNIKELASLAVEDGDNLFIDPLAFPNNPALPLWTSTHNARGVGEAWGVWAGTMDSFDRFSRLGVRLVKDRP